MIINSQSTAIQHLRELKKSGVIRYKYNFYLLSGIYNAIAYKVANGEPVIQSEIASMVGVDRVTVNRSVKKLVEFGMLKEEKGKVIKTKERILREYNKYVLLIQSEYLIFKRRVKEEIGRLIDYLGTPERKNNRLQYRCPCCDNKSVVLNPNKEKGYCYKCERPINKDTHELSQNDKFSISERIVRFLGRSWVIKLVE